MPSILEVLAAILRAEDPLCDYERRIQYSRTAVKTAETSLVEKNTGHFQKKFQILDVSTSSIEEINPRGVADTR